MGLNKLVDFSIAKLLKKKGFNEKCLRNYRPDGTIPPFDDLEDLEEILTQYENVEDYLYCKNSELGSDYVSAPTIADVVMWLYKNHSIWINVWSDTNLNLPEWKDNAKWFYVINCDLLSCYDNKGKNKQLFNTPTEAYLAAIEYSLKNLI